MASDGIRTKREPCTGSVLEVLVQRQFVYWTYEYVNIRITWRWINFCWKLISRMNANSRNLRNIQPTKYKRFTVVARCNSSTRVIPAVGFAIHNRCLCQNYHNDCFDKTIVLSFWVDQWKNANNLAVLHAIDTKLALIDYAWKCACYT